MSQRHATVVNVISRKGNEGETQRGEQNGRKRKEAEGPPVSVPWNHLGLWLRVFFFFLNFNFEMLPVVPGGGLRLRMTHW